MKELNRLIRQILMREDFDSIVLSGGIDSSLLAAQASKIRQITGVTMVLDGAEAPDRYYSRIVAEKLGIRHLLETYTLEEATDAARKIVGIMKTFDHIEIRNDITVYLAMKRCRDEELTNIITGDGGDELFAGYDYMVKMNEEELNAYIADLTRKWSFPASDLGRALGVRVIQPYIQDEVVDFALKLPAEFRVHRIDDRVYGKWILRSMLDALSLKEIALRTKNPIEVGSGSTGLSKYFLDSIGDEAKEIEAKALDENVRFWSIEQAYFYKIYREVVGKVPRPAEGEEACPLCGAPIPSNKIACTACGFVDMKRGSAK